MALTKKQRQQVREKSAGHCWYCGCQLPEKGWHADHIEPIQRIQEIVPREERKNKLILELRQTGECHKPERDNIKNMVPACAPCNLFKATYSVEGFRKQIEQQVERGRKSSVNFRTAERFGLIEVKPKSVEFWFERQGYIKAGGGE